MRVVTFLRLSYVMDARQRREVKGQLHYRPIKRFDAEPDITVASATFESWQLDCCSTQRGHLANCARGISCQWGDSSDASLRQ